MSLGKYGLILVILLVVIGVVFFSKGFIKSQNINMPLRVTPTTQSTSQTNLPQPVEAARQNLAKTLNIDASKITIEKIEKVEWPDSSLGCPKPGYFYSQVITPGYKVIFVAGQKRYEYHTNLNNSFVLCE